MIEKILSEMKQFISQFKTEKAMALSQSRTYQWPNNDLDIQGAIQ